MTTETVLNRIATAAGRTSAEVTADLPLTELCPDSFQLVEVIVDHKQEFATVHASLYRGISDSFDADAYQFSTHPGARDYLERDEPGFFERYAELAGVSFSVTLAVLSGLIALTRWRERVRKNRIDGYYAEILRVRAATLEPQPPISPSEALDQIKEIERRAFAELIKERLANMRSARETAELLLADALADGGTDNITLILGRSVRSDD